MSKQHTACYAALCRECHKRGETILVGVRTTKPDVNAAGERIVRCPECGTTNVCRPMMDPHNDACHQPQPGYGRRESHDDPSVVVDADRDDVVTFEGVDG